MRDSGETCAFQGVSYASFAKSSIARKCLRSSVTSPVLPQTSSCDSLPGFKNPGLWVDNVGDVVPGVAVYPLYVAA